MKEAIHLLGRSSADLIDLTAHDSPTPYLELRDSLEPLFAQRVTLPHEGLHLLDDLIREIVRAIDDLITNRDDGPNSEINNVSDWIYRF